MKTSKILSVFLTTFTLTSCSTFMNDRSPASNQKEELKFNISQTADYLNERQFSDHSFAGAFVSDVTQESIMLALGKKLELEEPELKKQLIETMIQRLEPSKLGWYSYPGGGVDHSVTGFALRSLEYVGVKLEDSVFKEALKSYEKNGGDKKINVTLRLQMGVLGLLPAKDSIPPIPPQFLNLNHKWGMKQLGIHGQLLYPLIGTRILSTLPTNDWQKHLEPSHEYMKMVLKTGEQFKNDKLYLKRTPLEVAKMTVAYSMQTRGHTKAWYGALFTACNVLLLKEAHRVGLGNFDQEIKDAWAAMKNWMMKSEEGFVVIQPSKSDIWDTASTVNALNSMSEDFKDEKNKLNPKEATQWLIKKRVNFKDQRRSATWSFDSTDIMLPDLDDTAAVVHAIATSEFKNDPEIKKMLESTLEWILERQNDDGGFPAWSKGVSQNLFGFLEKFAKLPKMADISQSDVTARILHMFHVIEPLNIIDQARLDQAKKKTCSYFVKSAEKIPNVKPKIFTGHWVSNYTYATSHLMKGLIYAECAQDPWIKEQLEWLISVQNQDGGFGEDNISYTKHEFVGAPSNISQTALTLVGMMEAYDYFKNKKNDRDLALEKSIERGIQFIIEKSENGTKFFEPEFTAIMVKGQIFARYELLNAYSTLYVLSKWHELKD
jgi:squalene-hopene/tetraprenyl-beta-curcumene cyclase